MTKEQIDFLKSLDPNQTDGTFQSIFMQEDLSAVPFEKLARKLISALKHEKDFLVADNINLSRRLDAI